MAEYKNGFYIGPMTEKYIDEVYAIETDSFSVPWTRESIVKDLTKNERSLYFCAFTGDNKVAGYAGMWHVVNEGHILNIAVGGRHRRLGIGSMLMDALFETARNLEMIALTLEVRIGNAPAMGLYHKYGFKVEGIRKNYYIDTHEDAVIMWRYL
jgi:ribosomal-protein-alanine N-acetyltransferase